MQKLSASLYNMTIFSLQTGHPIGTALRPLINPQNLKIEAWFADSMFDRGFMLLPISEIREITVQGIAVNDRDAITPAEDLVRLESLIRVDFQLLGKKVVDENKNDYGKVTDYAVNMESFYVQRIYATPSLLKLTSQQKIISRMQIVEITDKKIIVKGGTVEEKSFFKAPRPLPVPEG